MYIEGVPLVFQWLSIHTFSAGGLVPSLIRELNTIGHRAWLKKFFNSTMYIERVFQYINTVYLFVQVVFHFSH